MHSIELMPRSSVVRRDGDGIEMTFPADPAAPVFAGHYPGFPLLPGVFALDAVHHAVLRHARDTGGGTPVLAGIRSVRFLSPVLPGDTLTVEAAVAAADGVRDVRAVCRTARGKSATLRLRYRDAGRPDPAPAPRAPAAGADTAPGASHGVAVLKRLIPHRYPALLVDRVLAVEPGRRVVTRKAVTCNEPWYRDLPDETADSGYGYPAALLIESWCQSAALLAAWDRAPEELAGQVALFGGMSGIEVVGEVLPGDVLRHEVTISRALAGTWIFEGATSTADGRPVLTVDSVMTALRPSEVLGAPAHT
ncbi:3-hydroxyacyl-ACP dehydratase FabZ family protein [Streptomyces sp. NPDC004082]|uniref:3-hydroxyacyl-ACP dehydratase FabZ family protein n=2 Tax=Streptomyces TaxID=1883 RepID=UPI0033A5A95D